jgi:hypothetical protein
VSAITGIGHAATDARRPLDYIGRATTDVDPIPRSRWTEVI